MATEPTEACHTCRFWESRRIPQPFGPDIFLRCLRRSPVIGREGFTSWPQTRGDEWCGDFEPAAARVRATLRQELRANQTGGDSD